MRESPVRLEEVSTSRSEYEWHHLNVELPAQWPGLVQTQSVFLLACWHDTSHTKCALLWGCYDGLECECKTEIWLLDIAPLEVHACAAHFRDAQHAQLYGYVAQSLFKSAVRSYQLASVLWNAISDSLSLECTYCRRGDSVCLRSIQERLFYYDQEIYEAKRYHIR